MHVVIVIPCLNEERGLAATCASLGFGVGRGVSSAGCQLILVDNGSQDRTYTVMEQIQAASPPGFVVLAEEPERGYVPPRRRGVLTAQQLAREAGRREEEVLVLQADADTLYGSDYRAAMMAAALESAGNVLLEGTSGPPTEFVAEHPGFVRVCNAVDASVESLFVDTADDIIVSDSVAGYMLNDYFRWGGYLREYDARGDEIYVETSRLFIRAKSAGARRRQVVEATAVPSRREILVDPLRFFVTAGFPREVSWNASWRSPILGLDALKAFEDPAFAQIYANAVALRRHHLIALFAILPVHVAAVLGSVIADDRMRPDLRPLLARLPVLSRADLLRNTAPLFEALFSLVDSWPASLSGL